MKIQKRLITIIISLLPFLHLHAEQFAGFEIPGTQVVPIKNTETGGQYELYIKLPESYDKDGDTHYPVLYFTDAVWHIELLSASTAFLMENVILVGISWQTDLQDERAHISRFRDYSIRKSTNTEHQAMYQFGQANNHLEFIRRDVISYVESHYRTDPKDRTYFGFSAGGLFGAYTLMAKPDTFKNYILGSPSMRNNIPLLMDIDTSKKSNMKDHIPNVYITYGSLEDELGKYIENYIALLKTDKSDKINIQRVVIEGSHQTAFPLTGVRSITWLASMQPQREKP